jgi:hypothetical protein
MEKDDFKFIIPAELTKGADGEWKVAGLASTSSVDRQGEIIMPSGIDATPIAKGKGFFNWDHDNSPENTVGVLDSYRKSDNGMYVEGRLFKNHTRAKAVYEIMTSLNKGDAGRIGMSVEGKVLERDAKNPSIIKRCLIKNVALTMSPVNQDTFADIVKSMSASDIDFESVGNNGETLATAGQPKTDEATFTASQVVEMISKALSLSSAAPVAPAERSGGDALATESLDKDKKKVKMKKTCKSLYKSNMIVMLDKLQTLYPDNSRSEIWEAIKDRMSTKFPDLKE